MRPDSSRTLSLKVLLALTAAVLLAHLAVLQGTPMTLGLHLGLTPPPPNRAFSTRLIEPEPPKPPAAEPQLTPPVTTPHDTTPHTATPSERPVPAKMDAATGQTATPSPAQAAATPSESSPDERPADADPQPSAPRDQLAAIGAVSLPGSVRIKYKVETNKFPFGASAELRWQWGGENYDARLEVSAFGQARVQTSQGQITPQGLAPLRFSDKFRSEVAAHFNREKGKVTFSANTPDVALLAGAQDRLSVLVQLGAMIAGDPNHYPPGTTLTVQTIGPRDADTWVFTVGSKETLTLPGGEQATLKLVRNPRQQFDQKVELWLAPALGYLPARIRITEPNGDFVDQKWLATEPQT
ncbi:DUF3108 domain-containing protein [Rhodoferax sp. UBA5149]|uniref:DUF3108 domain-containing protein n=1 Tax=Rhodoferax sp. UBA5149 TaxID=1947379 RepID=UPI0025FF0898|nr:DUF3108 domain-containing protein [Rhodoferax sp. UBA5149]